MRWRKRRRRYRKTKRVLGKDEQIERKKTIHNTKRQRWPVLLHVPRCTLLPMNHDLGSSENSSTSQISVPFLLSRYLFAEPADKTRIIMEYTVGISTSQNLESDQIGDL